MTNRQDLTGTDLKTWLSKPRRGLITDVDGTISPIVDSPTAAQVTPRSKALLKALQRPLDLVAVVSGRAAADVQARVGVPGVVYVGNHGLERWQDGTVQVAEAVKAYRPGMQAVLDTLRPYETQIPGLLLEDKDATLSIHYRNVADKDSTAATLRPLLSQLGQQHDLKIFAGRMIFEVRPPIETNKGTALRGLISEYKLDAALYIGDDTTDVDAIKAARDLREQGVCYAFGVGVASEETPSAVLESSDFSVEGISGVESFLDWLSKASSS